MNYYNNTCRVIFHYYLHCGMRVKSKSSLIIEFMVSLLLWLFACFSQCLATYCSYEPCNNNKELQGLLSSLDHQQAIDDQ